MKLKPNAGEAGFSAPKPPGTHRARGGEFDPPRRLRGLRLSAANRAATDAQNRFFLAARWLAVAALLLLVAPAASAKGVDFGDVVKLVESHYGVKHKSLPMAARMGVKVGQLAARRLARYSEYGSGQFAVFEDQDFSPRTRPDGTTFAAAFARAVRPDWQPLVEVRTGGDVRQTFIYTKEAGKFFKVLVVEIGERDAVVVEVEVAPHKLMLLMRDPEAAGKTLSDETAEGGKENDE